MGDRLHAVLCAAGYNLRWLLRMITKTGLRAPYWLLPAEMRIAVQRILTAEAVSQGAWRVDSCQATAT